jgi:hypothetical protein
MNSAIKVQQNQEALAGVDDILNDSPPRRQAAQQNIDMVNELAVNLNGLASIDFTKFGGNQANLQHLGNAMNHLKLAQKEFEDAQKQMMQPEIIRQGGQALP